MGTKRILLKVSGEALGGDAGVRLQKEAVRGLANECIEVTKRDVQVAVVVGGGNFIRGGQLAARCCRQRGYIRYLG